MSTEPFIGEIKIFGFNFAPKGYATCQGQILPISTNTALFSLLGTTYGGNGQTTFGLPDLQGRMPISQGTGPGLPTHIMGEKAGNTNVTLLTPNLPPHIHTAQGITVNVPVATTGGDTDSPAGAYLGLASGDFYSSVPTTNSNYGALAVAGQTGIAGAGVPVSIVNPYLVVNYSIAINGIFPSRN
jgi:microcystin-dependent protein